MSMTCKYDCGQRIVDIGFIEAENCRCIRSENVYNIILQDRGSLTLRINGERVIYNAPCIWALKENLKVEFISSKMLTAQSIHFEPGFLYKSADFEIINNGVYKALSDSLNLVPLDVFNNHSDVFAYVLPLSDSELSLLGTLFTNFYDAVCRQNYSRWSCYTRVQINGILELMHRVYTDFIDHSNAIFDIQKSEVWVSILRQKIHSRYCEHINLETLSNEIGINRTTVGQTFRKIVGTSVGDYIVNYRLKLACDSLSNTEAPLKKIAKENGFNHEGYFIRQFQKRIGMSPTEYRQQQVACRKEKLK